VRCRTVRPIRRVVSTLLLAGAALAPALVPARLAAQADTPDVARAIRDLRTGRLLALEGRVDSALVFFTLSKLNAHDAGDQRIEQAAIRARADMWLLRSCADSAQRILRNAVALAPAGDRTSADALVRLLAERGQVADARAVMVSAYSDATGVGRTITRESITFLQGMAAVERAGGQEAAALSSFTSALSIAKRLHQGGVTDSIDTGVGEVTDENRWVLFDLASLRRSAKATGVRSIKEADRITKQLVEALEAMESIPDDPFPITRYGDRLVLRRAQCVADGTTCPAPVTPKGC